MYPLLVASFALITRKFPGRAFLKQTPLNAALGVYVLTLILTVFEEIFGPDPLSENMPTSIGGAVVLSIVSFFVIIVIGRWILNRYVSDPFSFKEIFILEMLLTAGAQIIFGVALLLLSFLGKEAMIAYDFVGLVFGIYMLLTVQSAISSIASISKSHAAHVILGPIVILFAALLGFSALIGGFVATMY